MPLRILHLIPSLDGGAGRGVIEIMRRHASGTQFTPRICVLGRRSPDLVLGPDEPVEYLDTPVHERATTFQRLTRLRKILKTWQPHLVHSHLWPAALTAGLVLPSTMPHLIHIRDTQASLTSRRLGDRLRRWSLQRTIARPSVRLVAVSAAASEYASRALGIAPDRITTIINGVDQERFLAVRPLPDQAASRMVIASAGRLIADKGFDHLIRAVALMKSRDQVLLRIAGIGSEEPGLRKLAQSLALAEQVEFAGAVADMPAYLEQADLFAHASIKEGMSRVLIEAMAAGRPVITMEHAGVDELVVNGVTGRIVSNDIAKLAQGLDELLHDRARLVRMGGAARERAIERFSIERVAREVGDLYLTMTGTPARALAEGVPSR